MRTILIVDDSLTVRMELAEALDSAGFRTIQCATIADARVALRSHPVALAILDIQLPDGDGFDLLVQIRKDFTLGELPVLMLSTEAEVRDRIRGLRGGANDFVGKPYDTYHVIARVRQLIESANGDATLFAREDSVEAAWRVVDPILGSTTPLSEYEPSTWGPTRVEQDLAPDGGWHEPRAKEMSG